MDVTVFISYAKDDRSFVARLVEDLQRFSIPVWKETFNQFDAGNHWLSRAEQALVSARHSF